MACQLVSKSFDHDRLGTALDVEGKLPQFAVRLRVEMDRDSLLAFARRGVEAPLTAAGQLVALRRGRRAPRCLPHGLFEARPGGLAHFPSALLYCCIADLLCC